MFANDLLKKRVTVFRKPTNEKYDDRPKFFTLFDTLTVVWMDKRKRIDYLTNKDYDTNVYKRIC